MSSKYRIIRRWDSESSPEQVKIIKGRSLSAPASPEAEREQQCSREDAPAQLTEEELRALQKLAACYERSLEYMEGKAHPWPYVWTSLILGMAKGFGVAMGITILAFVALKILNALQILNLPIIGEFIAELLDYINNIRSFGK
ncbi:MAG: hypothetical protein IJP07_05570 [Firmicutes bacterium]|nr:hypothetical protein [Bacillota bacterium]